MEHRLLLEQRGKSPEEVKVLNLDNCCSTTVVGITEEYCNLEVLSLINCNLTSLKGFPKLPKLRKLELSDNRISGGLHYLNVNTQLESLKLSGNKIKDFETLEPLKQLKNLKSLDLYKCDIAELENYRDKVFKLLPNLEYLDSFDRSDKEADSEIDDEANDDENEGDFESEEEDGENEDEEEEDEEENENDDEEDNEDEENEDEEDEVGLDYLEKDSIDEEEEGHDYNPDGVEDDDEEEDLDEVTPTRGQKRKRENDDE